MLNKIDTYSKANTLHYLGYGMPDPRVAHITTLQRLPAYLLVLIPTT